MTLNGLITGLKLMTSLSGQVDSTTVEQQVIEQIVPNEKIEQVDNSQNKTTKINNIIKESIQSSNIEYHFGRKDETNTDKSKARLNAFYKLPKINGFTFVEFYKDSGFFAKTNLSTPIYKGLSLRSEIKNSNLFPDHTGLGLQYVFSTPNKKTGGGLFAMVKALPTWFEGVDKKGSFSTVGGALTYSTKVKGVPVSFSMFGEGNVSKNMFLYGEAEVKVSRGKTDMGFGFDIYGKRKINTKHLGVNAIPRINVGYHMGFK